MHETDQQACILRLHVLIEVENAVLDVVTSFSLRFYKLLCRAELIWFCLPYGNE